jgi:hypothetical protein
LFLGSVSLLNFSFATFGLIFVSVIYLIPGNLMNLRRREDQAPAVPSKISKLFLLFANPVVWISVLTFVHAQPATFLGLPASDREIVSFFVHEWAGYLKNWNNLEHVAGFFPFITLILIPLNFLNFI